MEQVEQLQKASRTTGGETNRPAGSQVVGRLIALGVTLNFRETLPTRVESTA